MAPPFLLDTILRERTAALLQSGSDYRRYAKHLSSRLQRLRKTLKVRRRVPKAGTTSTDKYTTYVPTANDINADKRFVGILSLAAERAWAHGLEAKSDLDSRLRRDQAAGQVRYVRSKLEKSRKLANLLVDIVVSGRDVEASSSSPAVDVTDVERLQAVAYAELISAAVEFEHGRFERAVRHYAAAWLALSGLVAGLTPVTDDDKNNITDDDNDTADLYRDQLTTTVEPALKFVSQQVAPAAAARADTVAGLARKYVPRQHVVFALVRAVVPDGEVADALLLTSSGADSDDHEADHESGTGKVDATVREVTWRSHTARLRDASVVQAITAARRADDDFAGQRKQVDGEYGQGDAAAAAYDPVLLAWQDAADAVHAAITDAEADGSQDRVQELYVVSTFANYSLISRRIARDRVLLATLTAKKQAQSSSGRNDGKHAVNGNVLRQMAGIYDAIVQSIVQIQDLAGVAADEELASGLASLRSYFRANRLAVVAQSYGNHYNNNNNKQQQQESRQAALALWVRAGDVLAEVDEVALQAVQDEEQEKILFNVDVVAARQVIRTGILQSHGLAELSRLTKSSSLSSSVDNDGSEKIRVIVDDLGRFANGNVDLTKLVDLQATPKLGAVPAKPAFFDIAFNFVGYADVGDDNITNNNEQHVSVSDSQDAAGATVDSTTSGQQKKGWFWRR
ncbi:hypothetical protein V1514DRAFT_333496 [Lipomyces japonicus]|uniref:uncharacterized protein n=1 Tax=Lipomyces japonicus TaxID=56871 RepID=UPI0034CD83EE